MLSHMKKQTWRSLISLGILKKDVTWLVKFHICLSVLKSRQEYIILYVLSVALWAMPCCLWKLIPVLDEKRCSSLHQQTGWTKWTPGFLYYESSHMAEPTRQRQEKERDWVRCSLRVFFTQILIYLGRWGRQEKHYEGESANLLHLFAWVNNKRKNSEGRGNTAGVLSLWVMTPTGAAYQIFILLFRAVAKIQLWNSNEIILFKQKRGGDVGIPSLCCEYLWLIKNLVWPDRVE